MSACTASSSLTAATTPNPGPSPIKGEGRRVTDGDRRSWIPVRGEPNPNQSAPYNFLSALDQTR